MSNNIRDRLNNHSIKVTSVISPQEQAFAVAGQLYMSYLTLGGLGTNYSECLFAIQIVNNEQVNSIGQSTNSAQTNTPA